MKNYLLFALAILALTSCDTNKTTVNSKPSENNAATTAQENEADRELTQKVREALEEDEQIAKNIQTIQISTQNGVVKIRGNVPTESERTAITRKVSSVNGVKRVDNLLSIGQQK